MAVIVLISCGGFAEEPAPDTHAMRSIKAERIAAHMRFLSSDLLQGRGTGTRGYDIAAAYVAADFARSGLLPAGDPKTKSYLQNVPLRKTDLIRDSCSMVILREGREQTLKMDEDYLIYPDYSREHTTVEAEVVFAGYGITAPDLNYDDFSGIDASGKIVVMAAGGPSTFPNSARAHYSSSLMKEANAVAHGAVGILNIKMPDDELRSPWERSVRQSRLSGYRWVSEKGEPQDYFPQLQVMASLSRKGAEKLFSRANPALKDIFTMHRKKKMQGFPLRLRIRMTSASRLENQASVNVAGLLEGSDPLLKNEVVVYTAHLDHLGVGPAVRGDTIYNGAYDNASGTAMLLEMARAIAALQQRPKRTILFLAVTAEEKKLQGADYFVHYPSVPAIRIVANVNMDMLLLLFPLADAVVIGGEHSSLGPLSEQALRDVGLRPSPDPAPEEVIFVRSDQYAFIKKGVPSVFLVSGYTSLDAAIDGARVTREWLRTTYHSPQDDMNQRFDWASAEKLGRAGFLIGIRTANAPMRPSWNKDDFFGRTFGVPQTGVK